MHFGPVLEGKIDLFLKVLEKIGWKNALKG